LIFVDVKISYNLIVQEFPFLDRIDLPAMRVRKARRAGRIFRTCLPAGRYKEHKKILLIPGPDLACQDAVMESEAFISSENSCISTSRRTRAGWLCKAGEHGPIQDIL